MALTEKDLRAIGEVISEKIHGLPTREEVKALINAEIHSEVPKLIRAETLGLATSEELRRIAEKVEGLPTKDELYSLIDQVMGKHQATEQEHVMLSGRVRDHEDRITNLEEIHPGGSHTPKRPSTPALSPLSSSHSQPELHSRHFFRYLPQAFGNRLVV